MIRSLLTALPMVLLAACFGPDSATAPDCTVAAPLSPRLASPAPVHAPSGQAQFFAAIHAALASLPAGTPNPLRFSPGEMAVGEHRYYAAAVNAFFWGLPIASFWQKQGTAPAPVNEIYLAQQVNVSAYVVSPNTAVLYANGFMDLSESPWRLEYPDSGIYNVLQVMDAYTNVQASVGTRVKACGPVVLYWSGADYAEQVRKDYPDTAIALSTPQAWLLGRVAVDTYATPAPGAAPVTPYQWMKGDSPWALWRSRQVLAAYGAAALPQYRSGERVAQSVAAPDVASASDEQFLRLLAEAVGHNGLIVSHAGVQGGTLKPTATLFDQSLLFDGFRLIGLQPGRYDLAALSPTQAALVRQGFEDARAAVALLAASGAGSPDTGYWTLRTSLGQYEPSYTGWITAAVVAWAGLGANLAADGTYPSATVDSRNEALSGAQGRRYQIDFSATGAPPLDSQGGFWSVTVYDARNNLYPSGGNRYYETPQVGGVYALGSIEFGAGEPPGRILLQHAAPAAPDLPRWLPVPDGPFTLVMRVYNPVAANAAGVPTVLNLGQPPGPSPTWVPPPITRL